MPSAQLPWSSWWLVLIVPRRPGPSDAPTLHAPRPPLPPSRPPHPPTHPPARPTPLVPTRVLPSSRTARIRRQINDWCRDGRDRDDYLLRDDPTHGRPSTSPMASTRREEAAHRFSCLPRSPLSYAMHTSAGSAAMSPERRRSQLPSPSSNRPSSHSLLLRHHRRTWNQDDLRSCRPVRPSPFRFSDPACISRSSPASPSPACSNSVTIVFSIHDNPYSHHSRPLFRLSVPYSPSHAR